MRNHVFGFDRTRGLTFIELMVAIVVMAVLLVIAVPSVQESIKNNRLAGQNNELIALINLAKNEAVRRNQDVTVVLNADGNTWTGNVTVADGETTPGCPTGSIRCAEHDRAILSGDALTLTFNERGYLSDESEEGWPTANLCIKHEDPCSGIRQHRHILIFPTGQIDSTALSCSDPCPPS